MKIKNLLFSQTPSNAKGVIGYLMFFSLMLLTLMPFGSNVFGQTTVFTDDFNRKPLGDTGGTPTMTWIAGTDAEIQGQIQTLGPDPEYSVQMSGNNDPRTDGREFLTGSLSAFSSPFSSTLKNNTADVIWTFNMGLSNRAMSPIEIAFDYGRWGSAVILAMSGDNPTDPATNGYAVVMTQGTTTGDVVFSLVKFANGLIASANITSIIGTSPDFSPRVNWKSIKVIYTPSTDTWKLFVRDDGSASSSTIAPDPSAGTLTQVGMATIDDTYTSVAMSSCGFLFNHSTALPSSNWTRYDNFKVTVDAPITFTSGWPKVENVNSSGFNVKTNVSVAGTSYYVVLPNGATAPSSAQIKAGQDASGASLSDNLKGSIACASGATEYDAIVTGLASETTYDVYFVAENDEESNLQVSPTKVIAATSITTFNSNVNQTEKLFVYANELNVLGAKGQKLLISSLTGQVITNEVLTSDNQSFVLEKGLYIVRVSNQRTKVWIK